jgi:type I restriction enzyme S subunit
MTVQKNIPKLRFPEFSENWRSKKLGEIANFSKGKGISKSDIAIDGNFECIRYGELYTQYGETITKIVSKTSLPKNELIFSEINDVIIPASGETQLDIATASCVLKHGIALGGDLNIIKSQENGVFLSFYLNNKKKKDIASLAQGVSVVHLYSSQLSTLDLNLPTLFEQTKIANFLTAIDEKIQGLIEKKRLLEEYKKGLIQQIFSQEIRFKQDDGSDFHDWEEKSFKGLFTIGSGRDYKHLKKGNIPVFGTGGYMTSVDDFLYDGETVCIGRKGTIDKPMFFDGKIWTVDTLFYTHSFQKVLPRFIFYVFNTINWKEYNEASGVPSLSKSTIEKILTFVPSIPEQQKIASFLSSIDTKIERVGQQINDAQTFKKGLLQQMFV